MAYFSSFDISIAAYLQISEVLFLFLSKPYMYLPLILMLISMPLTTLYTYNDSNSKTASIKERYKAFSSFSFSLIIINLAIIFTSAYLYDVLSSFWALFLLILPLLVFVIRWVISFGLFSTKASGLLKIQYRLLLTIYLKRGISLELMKIQLYTS